VTFQMKRAAGCILRAFGNNKGLLVKNVDVLSIIGYRINGNGNVQNADLEQQSEVEV
jgi:hypothetical protein